MNHDMVITVETLKIRRKLTEIKPKISYDTESDYHDQHEQENRNHCVEEAIATGRRVWPPRLILLLPRLSRALRCVHQRLPKTLRRIHRPLPRALRVRRRLWRPLRRIHGDRNPDEEGEAQKKGQQSGAVALGIKKGTISVLVMWSIGRPET